MARGIQAILFRTLDRGGIKGRNADDFKWFAEYFPAVEGRNGQMLTSATFPTYGCWEVTVTNDGRQLTFVLSIQP